MFGHSVETIFIVFDIMYYLTGSHNKENNIECNISIPVGVAQMVQ